MIIKICTYVMLLIHIGLMLSPWVLVKIWKTFDVDCLLNSSSMPDAFFFYDSAALPVNSSVVFLQAVLCNC